MRLALVMLGACSAAAPPAPLASAKPPEPLFVQVDLPGAAPGLSGLAVDGDGGVWAVAERAAVAYRITLDAALVPTLETFAIENIPPGIDLEAIAWLDGDLFVLGTEGRDAGQASVLYATREAGKLVVAPLPMSLTSEDAGVEIGANHGAEGICSVPTPLDKMWRYVVAFETAGIDAGKRWAPVVVIDGGNVTRRHRVWLTSETGKLSALDCRLAKDGTLEVLAIERHFEVTKFLVFTLGESLDVTPRVALDLGPTLVGRLNLEGIAWLGDRVIAVVDNQWKTISGPSALLVFRAGSVR